MVEWKLILSLFLCQYIIRADGIATTKNPSDGCRPDEWQCDNKQCINSEFLCDQQIDCTDASDEGVVCQTTRGKKNVFIHKEKNHIKTRHIYLYMKEPG